MLLNWPLLQYLWDGGSTFKEVLYWVVVVLVDMECYDVTFRFCSDNGGYDVCEEVQD